MSRDLPNRQQTREYVCQTPDRMCCTSWQIAGKPRSYRERAGDLVFQQLFCGGEDVLQREAELFKQRRFAGADSPKVVMPITRPSRPTYLYQ